MRGPLHDGNVDRHRQPRRDARDPTTHQQCDLHWRAIPCQSAPASRPGLQDHRIGPIAYRAGFQSIPAFNRAFREAYGQTPRSARKTEGSPVCDARPRGKMGVLTRWLLEIS